MSDNVSALHRQLIEAWWTKLCARIDYIRNSGNRVILVALSRKMPRFFQWIEREKTELFSDSSLQNRDIREDCEFITEHAIPFVVSSQEDDNYDFIIVDDTIIFGETIRTAANTIFGLTGKLPYLSSIFVSQRFTSVTYANEEDIVSINRLDDDRTAEALEFVAQKNLEVALPIDMEYPILYYPGEAGSFYLNEALVNVLKGQEQGQCLQQNTCYKFDYSTNQLAEPIQSYTFVYKDSQEEAYNNDFIKVRLFESRRNNRLKVVSYAPNVIPQNMLRETTLFKNTEYQHIWKEILTSISELPLKSDSLSVMQTVIESLNRTLTVFANYLFSLSTVIRILEKKENIWDLSNAEIAEDDLQLILGRKHAKKLHGDILNLLRNKLVSPTTRRRVILPSFIQPEEMRRIYKIERNTAFVRNISNPREALKDVFTLQHFRDGISNRYISDIERMSQKIVFGETFESLCDLLSLFGKTKDLEKDINQWIDAGIDNGNIVPKYECVKNEDGTSYWKRYFTAGTVSLKN